MNRKPDDDEPPTFEDMIFVCHIPDRVEDDDEEPPSLLQKWREDGYDIGTWWPIRPPLVPLPGCRLTGPLRRKN